jgi:hypothetical protein
VAYLVIGGVHGDEVPAHLHQHAVGTQVADGRLEALHVHLLAQPALAGVVTGGRQRGRTSV